jgi:hypothetical protein
MRRARTFLSIPTLAIATFALAACATPSVRDAAPAKAGGAQASAEGDAREIAGLERKLALARERLAVAKLEAAAYEQAQAAQARHVAAEVKLAEASLARFVEADMPNRLAGAKLDLQGAKDRAQEAADELAQIKIMYAEQDLDDLTAEFVVSRGERSAARAVERLAIQASALAALEQRELPQERERLALALDKAGAGASEREREAEIGRHKQAIAVRESENEIARLEGELAALREKAKP